MAIGRFFDGVRAEIKRTEQPAIKNSFGTYSPETRPGDGPELRKEYPATVEAVRQISEEFTQLAGAP